MSDLLSRHAENLFWLARYIERAENLARLLDVHSGFSRDRSGRHNWRSILEIHSDEARFFADRDQASTEAVIAFYVLDRNNPTSIISCLSAARENGRTLRHLISTEMWSQLNVFYNAVLNLYQSDVAEPRLSRFAGFIKENCQTHTGITEGTFYRDAGWHFYQIGRNLERADQMTRLLTAKRDPGRNESAEPARESSQWMIILRSAAGYHAYRRVHSGGMTASEVIGFLLFNQGFPRSLAACAHAVNLLLTEARGRYHLTGGAEALELLDELDGYLEGAKKGVPESEMLEFLDGVQRRLIAVSNAIGRSFFGHA